MDILKQAHNRHDSPSVKSRGEERLDDHPELALLESPRKSSCWVYRALPLPVGQRYSSTSLRESTTTAVGAS